MNEFINNPRTIIISQLKCFQCFSFVSDRLQFVVNFSDRYFSSQCEPMDATVSPIELTNHSNLHQGDSSNGSSSNPGTPSWTKTKTKSKNILFVNIHKKVERKKPETFSSIFTKSRKKKQKNIFRSETKFQNCSLVPSFLQVILEENVC